MDDLEKGDAWKGEHLIRARKAAPDEDIRRLIGAGEPVSRMRPKVGLCAFPGCGKKLWAGATSGVCADHRHARGHCQCNKCVQYDAKRGAK